MGKPNLQHYRWGWWLVLQRRWGMLTGRSRMFASGVLIVFHFFIWTVVGGGNPDNSSNKHAPYTYMKYLSTSTLIMCDYRERNRHIEGRWLAQGHTDSWTVKVILVQVTEYFRGFSSRFLESKLFYLKCNIHTEKCTHCQWYGLMNYQLRPLTTIQMRRWNVVSTPEAGMWLLLVDIPHLCRAGHHPHFLISFAHLEPYINEIIVCILFLLSLSIVIMRLTYCV